jgi:alpha-galactosidase
LETMRRAVPLWRSDFVYDPTGMQCLTYGISFWLPYHGTGNMACANAGYYAADSAGTATPVEPYAFWSTCCPANNFAFDMRARDMDYEALRRLFAQRQQIAPNYFGDYYPLTPYRQQEGVWTAWQFNRPAVGKGLVQAFRRVAAEQPTALLKLRGLDADAPYQLTGLERYGGRRASGRDLMEKGLTVTIPTKPGAAVIVYELVP